jgi:hypothetical protein
MSSLYLLLLPLFLLVIYKKVIVLVASVKEGNSSKIKADVFFLALAITLIIALVMAIEFI